MNLRSQQLFLSLVLLYVQEWYDLLLNYRTYVVKMSMKYLRMDFNALYCDQLIIPWEVERNC